MKTVIYARVINSVSDEPIENGMVEIEDDHIVYVGEKPIFVEARSYIRLVTHHMICFLRLFVILKIWWMPV